MTPRGLAGPAAQHVRSNVKLHERFQTARPASRSRRARRHRSTARPRRRPERARPEDPGRGDRVDCLGGVSRRCRPLSLRSLEPGSARQEPRGGPALGGEPRRRLLRRRRPLPGRALRGLRAPRASYRDPSHDSSRAPSSASCAREGRTGGRGGDAALPKRHRASGNAQAKRGASTGRVGGTRAAGGEASGGACVAGGKAQAERSIAT